MQFVQKFIRILDVSKAEMDFLVKTFVRRCRGSNPGHPRDRREYLPLYYNDFRLKERLDLTVITRFSGSTFIAISRLPLMSSRPCFLS